MTSADFRFIRELAYRQTGIVLPERKQHMVYSRLCRRLRALRLATFKEYCQYLLDTPDELGQFINALTTNLTSFFREKHHFDYLKNTLVTSWQQQQKRRIRIWSSACSTGEEPYSIAMSVASLFGNANCDTKILATDLDTNVLQKAQAGVYPMDALENIPNEYQEKFLMRSGSQIKIKDKLQQHIHFKQLNLLNDWPMQGKFDVIFCRNVLIYFDNETKTQIINKFRRFLADDGALFIGHSETLHQISDDFSLIGHTIYKPI
ncbi:protein-glutamate O-methyltransferase CheR [Shewanella submarina]|uniref:protein-glutamate O-methyltransferase n=1 Tax=Shewanella submarina TaxID=2016376 RepID=A0ABV7GEU3_9GAMM|nr:protein-glutamate O-methyltransferase CheR [Shewanella submarina]MCL1038855.1 protein-glutamate O-methyltransferase CheR [Shewanella submarina]